MRQNSYRQTLTIADAHGILDYLGVDYRVPGQPEADKPQPKPEPPTKSLVLLMLYRAMGDKK